MAQHVRVRFAPSPTGPLHIGGVRTALFNYLFARKHQGQMLLRIEDTDQKRFVEGAEAYIKDALDWLCIKPDESPWAQGEVGPYRQSERKDLYKQYADKLLAEGNAYLAFDTEEELEAMRERLKAANVDNPQYNSLSRMSMKNSLTRSPAEVDSMVEQGIPFVIRLKVPPKDEIRFNDQVRGWIKVHSHTIDDKVLVKSDGLPTYHLANVVDDHLMGITHVIRGEEWLPSAPLHVLLYRFLGWEASMPAFVHLPLLLKPTGKGKLSKRDGDKMGFPVFPVEWKDPETGQISPGFRERGYLPEALVNFLALLGWSPGDDREMFSMEELIAAFSLERIVKAGTRFDIEKAKWFNQQYIKQRPIDDLAAFLLLELETENIACSMDKAHKIAEAMRERVTFPQEIWTTAQYFFRQPENYDDKVARKKWNAEAVGIFEAYIQALKSAEAFDEVVAKAVLEKVLDEKGVKIGKVMQALRLALTGAGGGPDLMVIMGVLGKEEVIERLELAIGRLAEYAN